MARRDSLKMTFLSCWASQHFTPS